MLEATLCFLVKGNPPHDVLLGLKKKGFGVDKYAGIGGKVEPGETAVTTAVRELYEEIHILASPNNLGKAGHLTFLFPHKPDWSQQVHVYCLDEWVGIPQESAEMRPQWFKTTRIPFDQMWQDGQHWLPLVLNRQYVQAAFTFAADNETIFKCKIETWPMKAEETG
jgi:8-oxo-dGTP diphosphatase